MVLKLAQAPKKPSSTLDTPPKIDLVRLKQLVCTYCLNGVASILAALIFEGVKAVSCSLQGALSTL